MAALAASKQGKFWEFNDRLFANQNKLNDTIVQEIAKELSLNLEQFNQDLKVVGLESLIERDIKDGIQAEIQGIPAVFVNGKFLSSRSPQGLSQMIEFELRKKK